MDPVTALNGGQPHFNRYWYASNNPYKFKDPDGRAIETVWDAASLGMGVNSLVGNVREGNWGAAVVDGLGVIADGAATLVPGVPGGAGAAIGAIRMMDKVSNMAAFLKTSDFGRSIAGSLSKTSQRVDGQSVYRVTDNAGTLKKGDQIYLDGKHKDHFEVYDKNGKAKAVLNMDGTVNAKKTEAALEEGRRLPKK